MRRVSTCPLYYLHTLEPHLRSPRVDDSFNFILVKGETKEVEESGMFASGLGPQ